MSLILNLSADVLAKGAAAAMYSGAACPFNTSSK